MDEDIPIVNAHILHDQPPPAQFVNSVPAASRPILTKGRSSRVHISSSPGDVQPLGENETLALKDQGYTGGLIESLTTNSAVFPLRVWVVDNSGSMSMGDGHRLAESRSSTVVKLVKCTRWSELQQTVEYHAQIAGLIKAPTVFRLLNDPGRMIGPQQFSVAENGPKMIGSDINIAIQTMRRASPSGCTPLSDHIREIRENVLAMLPQLQSTGQKVAIVLATDGLPTNSMGMCNSTTRREFEENLRSLIGLPIWLVVRLCTDEDSVVDYYNNLDGQLELSLEVLDDWVGESKEVYEHNPWLTYGLSLHRMREMGYHHRLFDLLDERRLTLDELKEFLVLLLGESELAYVPDPNADFKSFYEQVSISVHKEEKQWNPVTKRMSPWIDMKKMKSCYGDSCTIM